MRERRENKWVWVIMWKKVIPQKSESLCWIVAAGSCSTGSSDNDHAEVVISEEIKELLEVKENRDVIEESSPQRHSNLEGINKYLIEIVPFCIVQTHQQSQRLKNHKRRKVRRYCISLIIIGFLKVGGARVVSSRYKTAASNYKKPQNLTTATARKDLAQTKQKNVLGTTKKVSQLFRNVKN